MWVPCPVIMVLVIDRHGQAEFAALIRAAYRTMDRRKPLHLFADLGAMSNYDSGLRTDLTSAFMPDRERIASFPILLRSKLVAMGVTVAGLALGSFVRPMDDRYAFKKALDSALFEHQVSGFSSEVLETPRLRAVGGE